MNLKRIVLWAGLAYLATFVAGFLPGMIRGVYAGGGGTVPEWTFILQALLVPAAMLIVFFRFARVQRERTVAHATAVWALLVVISVTNLVLGITLSAWLISIVFSGVVAVVGVALGLAVNKMQEE